MKKNYVNFRFPTNFYYIRNEWTSSCKISKEFLFPMLILLCIMNILLIGLYYFWVRNTYFLISVSLNYCADETTRIFWNGIHTKSSAVFLHSWVQQAIQPVRFIIFTNICFAMTCAGPRTWILPQATRCQVIALEELCDIKRISAVPFGHSY